MSILCNYYTNIFVYHESNDGAKRVNVENLFLFFFLECVHYLKIETLYPESLDPGRRDRIKILPSFESNSSFNWILRFNYPIIYNFVNT